MIKYLQPIILFMAKIRKKKLKKGNRSKLERKLDEVNHTVELRLITIANFNNLEMVNCS